MPSAVVSRSRTAGSTQQVGSGYLVLKPNAEQYKIVFKGEDAAAEPSCEVLVKKAGAGAAAAAAPVDGDGAAAAAEEAGAKDRAWLGPSQGMTQRFVLDVWAP